MQSKLYVTSLLALKVGKVISSLRHNKTSNKSSSVLTFTFDRDTRFQNKQVIRWSLSVSKHNTQCLWLVLQLKHQFLMIVLFLLFRVVVYKLSEEGTVFYWSLIYGFSTNESMESNVWFIMQSIF